MTGLLLRTNGKCEVVEMTQPLWKCLSALVDDSIDIVRGRWLRYPLVMVSGDCAVVRGRPLNFLASFFYGIQEHNYGVCGDVVICQEVLTDDGYDLAGLTPDQLAALTAVLGDGEKGGPIYV